MNFFPNEVTTQIFSYLISPPQISPDSYRKHDQQILTWTCQKKFLSLVNNNWLTLSKLKEFSHPTIENMAQLPRFKQLFHIQQGLFKVRALTPEESLEFHYIPSLVKNEPILWNDGKDSYELKTGESFLTKIGTNLQPERRIRFKKPILSAAFFPNHLVVNSGKKIHIISKNDPQQRYKIFNLPQPKRIFVKNHHLIVQDIDKIKVFDFSETNCQDQNKHLSKRSSFAFKVYLIKEIAKELFRFFKTEFFSILKKSLLYTLGISVFIISITAIPLFCGAGIVIPLIVAAVSITAVFLGFLIGHCLKKELEPLNSKYLSLTDPYYKP